MVHDLCEDIFCKVVPNVEVLLCEFQGFCNTSTSLTDESSYPRVLLLNFVNRNRIPLLHAVEVNIPELMELIIVPALVVDKGSAEKKELSH